MAELIRPSTVLPGKRTEFEVRTSDGVTLVGEVAEPLHPSRGAILCLHPLPTAGGMMDSHIFKKAAYRLPALADITVVRFNTRGTTSERGTSSGEFDNGDAEGLDVEAMINYCFDVLNIKKLWVVGWSFGTDVALRHARDPRVQALILLSPPLRTSKESDLVFWAHDGRPVIALVPELDDYLRPDEAKTRFSKLSQLKLIAVEGAKHLWVGEPSLHRVLSEITEVIAPEKLPLPLEY